jgi:hypothetical protein
MTKLNRLGIYADVRAVLDAALEHGGGTFTAPDHGAAVHWRQRAYRFRKAYAETLGPQAMSPYDTLVLPRLAEGSSEVIITVRQVGGTFTPANGVIGLSSDDELMREAEALAQRLGGMR